MEALELRKAGASYDQIGKQLRITKQSAHALVAGALKDMREKTEDDALDVIRLELERLDAMLLGMWDEARRGKLDAIDRVLRLMKRRAELLGLDAPESVQQTDGEDEPSVFEIRLVD